MRGNGLAKALLVVGGLLALVYVAAGIVGVAAGATEETSDTVFWLVLLVGGGVLLALGLWLFRRGASAGGAAALASVGAAAGALALFWSVAAPIAAVAVIVLAVLNARRLSTAA